MRPFRSVLSASPWQFPLFTSPAKARDLHLMPLGERSEASGEGTWGIKKNRHPSSSLPPAVLRHGFSPKNTHLGVKPHPGEYVFPPTQPPDFFEKNSNMGLRTLEFGNILISSLHRIAVTTTVVDTKV